MANNQNNQNKSGQGEEYFSEIRNPIPVMRPKAEQQQRAHLITSQKS